MAQKLAQKSARGPNVQLVSSNVSSAFSTASIPSTPGWDRLAQSIVIRQRYQVTATESVAVASISSGPSHSSAATSEIQPISVGRSLNLGTHATLTPLSTGPTILELVVADHHWLIWDPSIPLSLAELSSLPLPSSHVWYWAGNLVETLTPFLGSLSPQAIPQQAMILPTLPNIEQLRAANWPQISFYSPNLDHVVQWMPGDGFAILKDGPEPEPEIF